MILLPRQFPQTNRLHLNYSATSSGNYTARVVLLSHYFNYQEICSMSSENIQVFDRPLECTEWLSNSSEHDLNILEMILEIKPNIHITTKQKSNVKRMSIFFVCVFFKVFGTFSFNWIYSRTKPFHIIYFGYYGQLFMISGTISTDIVPLSHWLVYQPSLFHIRFGRWILCRRHLSLFSF